MSSDNAAFQPRQSHSGFVCLSGPTNAGKSTLMNALVGQKIAIITPKPQTTRNRILGIHTVADRGQLIFVDTPGFHQPKSRLGKRMVELAMRSIHDTDLVLLVVDATLDAASSGFLADANRQAALQVASSQVPTVLALNKVDRIRPKERLLQVIDAYDRELGLRDIYPISALTGSGLAQLEADLLTRLPVGPPLYPEDMLSDQVERFLAAEIIREKVILLTRQEIPYSVAVEVESFKEPEAPGGTLRISALIFVERESQKGIVIGKGGALLKQIGTRARQELEVMFQTRVFLELVVKVSKDWPQDIRRLARFGY
ncbi:MAG: GTPase Era [Bradymonadales bacterium]|nr:GTPase Era [Bradymonadales bacterium]